MKRMRRICLAVTVIVVCAIPVSVWLFAIRPLQIHRQWYRKVEHQILKLTVRRPLGVSKETWGGCFLWTWNLHANYGGHSYFRAESRDDFLREFDERLESEVDLKTIDWIWDQYLIHAPRSRNYAHYRPTISENLAEFTEPSSDHLSFWAKELQRREAEMQW